MHHRTREFAIKLAAGAADWIMAHIDQKSLNILFGNVEKNQTLNFCRSRLQHHLSQGWPLAQQELATSVLPSSDALTYSVACLSESKPYRRGDFRLICTDFFMIFLAVGGPASSQLDRGLTLMAGSASSRLDHGFPHGHGRKLLTVFRFFWTSEKANHKFVDF